MVVSTAADSELCRRHFTCCWFSWRCLSEETSAFRQQCKGNNCGFYFHFVPFYTVVSLYYRQSFLLLLWLLLPLLHVTPLLTDFFYHCATTSNHNTVHYCCCYRCSCNHSLVTSVFSCCFRSVLFMTGDETYYIEKTLTLAVTQYRKFYCMTKYNLAVSLSAFWYYFSAC